ncbi:MAG: chromate transporter [Flavobacterium psychrophilum]|nr:MAG: chromate transporter [Flavobacterium psychrophilum]
MTQSERIKDIARLFLKLGFTAFGGPAAHIAMMQQEVVRDRKWMDEQRFLDLVGAVNLIPGPNSTELAIHIGHERGGWRGLIVAGLCFIVPAVLITGIFAWLYKEYGQLPELQPFIYGIKPAVIAVIIAAIFPLAKKSAKNTLLVIIGMLVLALSLLDINEFFLMFGAGIVALLFTAVRTGRHKGMNAIYPFGLFHISGIASDPELNMRLFLMFLKMGAILYGSGYVLFAFLDTELVAIGFLTRQQLIDAIAVGQFTPGPVFSSVTFVGWQINGITGAAVSTLAIFLPSFAFVALLSPLVKEMRGSDLMGAFMDAVNIASVAIIIAVCCSMAVDTVSDWKTVLITLLSLYIVFRYRINSAFIVIGGSIAGYIFYLLPTVF